MGPVDRWLVWRLQRGDTGACRDLIARYHGGIYGYLRRLGADSHQAEDLTQETYAKAWRGIGRLREAASLRAWLLTIARNEFLQSIRARRPETTGLDQVPEPADPDAGALGRLEVSERDGNLRRAVRRLDAPLLEVVALHYFQGLSLREMSQVLEIPPGTAKSRLNRALDNLRDLLREREEKNHVRSETRKAPAGTA